MLKATIFDIKRFAVHDGHGIRTTVFLKGCPLDCVWCHNPEGKSGNVQLGFFAHKCVNCGSCVSVCASNAQSLSDVHLHRLNREKCRLCGKCIDSCPSDALLIYGKQVTVDEIFPELVKDRAFYECSGGGVTLSGGEPLMHPDFCLDLLTKLKNEGIDTAVDTCGFISPEVLKSVIPYTDTFLYDVKHMNSDIHRRFTGQPNELILSNLRLLSESNARTEIRIPFVPGYNDDEKNLKATGKFLSTLKGIAKVKLLPYHDYARSKYSAIDMKDTLPVVDIPTDDELHLAAALLCSYGLNAVSGRD